MKTLRLLPTLLLLAFVAFGSVSFAQITNEQRKTDNKIKKEIKKNALREARKEAKKFKRQGFVVSPGSLPMEKQLERTWIMQLERNPDGELTYIHADGNGVANTFTAAQMQAYEVAKLNLAGQLETIVRAIVETSIANEQLSAKEAESVTRVVSAGKNIIATKIGRIDPTFVITRTLKNNNVEVNVKLMYNKETIVKQAKEAIRDQLRKDLGDLHGKLDKVIGLE